MQYIKNCAGLSIQMVTSKLRVNAELVIFVFTLYKYHSSERLQLKMGMKHLVHFKTSSIALFICLIRFLDSYNEMVIIPFFLLCNKKTS